MNATKLALSPESLNAIVEAMTSVAHAIIRNVPREVQGGILQDLEYMAERWNAAGHSRTETILLQVAAGVGGLLSKDAKHPRSPE